jgi:hypothetical protein
LPIMKLRNESRLVEPQVLWTKSIGKALITKLGYSVRELPKIPGETFKALDEFSYLPVWFTMPIIFVSSVVLGAVLALSIGF